MSTYLKDIPKILQEDFVENKVVPFVGAGFSKNAIIPQGLSMPDWNELGHQISTYIPDYEYISAIDALSLFETQFSRVKLVELLAKQLNINEIKPGESHRSFCNVFFDTICTTNFDFLLEHTLQETKRPHSIIVSEDRLPINTDEKTKLIKLHGDFNHPKRMVVTEHDYDVFLDKNRVLATYVSNLFITKTLFLVGYSFDDHDLRGLWQIINSRLGQLHRPAYAVMVDANPIEISRFERRKIKVINLKGKKADYQPILNQFFTEVKNMIDEKSPSRITVTNEKVREELKFPGYSKRLCFISAPNARMSLLKTLICPILEDYAITPVTLSEVIMPGDSWMAKSTTLLKEASLAIVDMSDNNINVAWELGVIHSLKKEVIAIIDEEQFQTLPHDMQSIRFIRYNINSDNEKFMTQLNEALSTWGHPHAPNDNEPGRLLLKSEYNAAIISAFRLLEITLREHKDLFARYSVRPMLPSLSQMLGHLRKSNLPQDLVTKAVEFSRIRNQIVHETITNINKKMATEIVETICCLIDIIKHNGMQID